MSKQAYAVFTTSVTASGALTAGTFIKPTGAVAGAGENTLGVALSDAASGKQCPVAVLGTASVLSGAAVTKDASLKVDSAGKAIDWASSGAKVAIAREAATAADQWIEVLLIPNCA